MESKIPHVNLIICTPGHSVMTPYLKSLLDLSNVLAEKGITWAFSSEYSSHVADAREITLNGDRVNNVKEQRPFKGDITYDKLMWIDSDIAFKPEDVLKLYESDKDIVSGAYLLGSGEVVAYPKLFDRALTIPEVDKLSGVTEVDAVGFGFVCIKQGIFEQMSRPWFQAVNGTYIIPDSGEEFTFPIMGEDLSWCHRAKSMGFNIWLDPSIKVLHHKMMRLTWEGPMA